MSGFDHTQLDAKWQAFWAEHQTFATPTDRTRPKYYVLDMFPYPSGDGLHVGHPKGYTATDVVARAKRMMGFNVLRVMGWDSFGLPAERRAERTGEHPSIITARNIATFKGQLQKLGLSYDWSRELATSDPRYYKWTQWIFELIFERGLAYRAERPVNFCPALGTVLANEEVHDGKYVETGDPVEKRLMTQWELAITKYADRLLDDLEGLDWDQGTLIKQRDWIGRSVGANVAFAVAGRDPITVFTTRPDTLFGGTWVVLAPEHPLVDALTTDAQRAAVAAYRAQVANRTDRDRTTEAADAPKTGVFTGAFAVNPVTGKPVPVWIADYVLASYGTGAVFACPAHDERDHAFATKFELPIVRVVEGGELPYTGDGPHINSEFLDGLDNATAKTKVIAWLEERKLGSASIRYKLRDWLFSRQRYWGEPFPTYETPDGVVHLVPKDELPVVLPAVDEYKATRDGQPPLARAKDWLPYRGGTRETNTMPQWAGSCWYYLRFLSPQRDDVAWDAAEEKYWMPVDLYVGGSEHAVLHLLYARFWHKVLFDAGLVTTVEPFQRLFHQGMIHKTSFRDPVAGKYHHDSEVEFREKAAQTAPSGIFGTKAQFALVQHEAGRIRGQFRRDDETIRFEQDGEVGGRIALSAQIGSETVHADAAFTADSLSLRIAGREYELARQDAWFVKGTEIALETKLDKMSKSKYNVVNPDDMCAEYGADAMRMYELFMGPLEDGVEWETNGVAGTRRFLDRVWRLLVDTDRTTEAETLSAKIGDAGADNKELERALHAAIKKVTSSVTDLRFNTAISEMMVFVNEATKAPAVPRAWFESFVRILAPFAPHVAEELWQWLGHAQTIAYEPWPAFDEAKLQRDVMILGIQVGGKLRGQIEVATDATEASILALAKADEKVAPFLADKAIKREIYVKGRLVNFVV